MNGKEHGWGIMSKLQADGGWIQVYKGQFSWGKRTGLGVLNKSKEGVFVKTSFKNGGQVMNTDISVCDWTGLVLAIGISKKCIGKDLDGFDNETKNGLVGLLFRADKTVRYVGDIGFGGMIEWGFGARVVRSGGGWEVEFGLWKDGNLLRHLTSSEIYLVKHDWSMKGIICA